MWVTAANACRIFDLLGDLSEPDQAKDFTIVEDKDGKGTHARGLSEVPVTSEEEALNLLFRCHASTCVRNRGHSIVIPLRGELSRTTAQHKLNRRSNRSHSIFTIYIKQKPRSGVREKITHSKLHLVDLAGLNVSAGALSSPACA
jgi:kinesin family protein 6/9